MSDQAKVQNHKTTKPLSVTVVTDDQEITFGSASAAAKHMGVSTSTVTRAFRRAAKVKGKWLVRSVTAVEPVEPENV